MNRATLRNGFAAIALIAVAACTAAGSQSSQAIPASGVGAAGSDAALAPDRRRHPKPTKQKQRNLAGAALSIAGASVDLDEFGSANGLLSQLLNFGHDVAHTRTRAPRTSGSPTCQNGVEYTWSSTGQGQVSQTIEFFYDAACTEPYNLITLNATFTSAGGSAQGTQETFDQNGNVIGYQTYNATFTPGINGGIGQIQVLKTAAPGPSSSPTSQTGFTCLFNTGNAIDCGSGTVTTLASASPTPEEVGFEQTVVGQFVTPSPGPSGSPWPSSSP
jgi:hypothetical protein